MSENEDVISNILESLNSEFETLVMNDDYKEIYRDGLEKKLLDANKKDGNLVISLFNALELYLKNTESNEIKWNNSHKRRKK